MTDVATNISPCTSSHTHDDYGNCRFGLQRNHEASLYVTQILSIMTHQA